MAFVKDHLEAFRSSNIGQWEGARPPGKWIKAVGHSLGRAYSHVSLDQPARRADLLHMRADRAVPIADLCAFIFAWGGMRVSNGKRIFKEPHDWVGVADGLRHNRFDHYEAYKQFFALSHLGKMPGCLPAFYSKLLFFLPGSGEHGIIMDQWTSRSINLLTGRQLVRLIPLHDKQKNYRVSKGNDGSVYKTFCEAVHELARELDREVEQIEMRMFSEGNGNGAWRSYVRANDNE